MSQGTVRRCVEEVPVVGLVATAAEVEAVVEVVVSIHQWAPVEEVEESDTAL